MDGCSLLIDVPGPPPHGCLPWTKREQQQSKMNHKADCLRSLCLLSRHRARVIQYDTCNTTFAARSVCYRLPHLLMPHWVTGRRCFYLQAAHQYLFKNNLALCGHRVHLIPHSKREAVSCQVQQCPPSQSWTLGRAKSRSPCRPWRRRPPSTQFDTRAQRCHRPCL